MVIKEAFDWLALQLAAFFTQMHTSFTNLVPVKYHAVISLLIFSFLIVFYSFFIWKFHKLFAKRDVVTLDLSKYRWSTSPFLDKLSAAFFFIVDHIVVLPFVLTFWFGILSVFLLLLSKGLAVETIAIIAAVIIASTRLLSYYSYDLSKEIAKIFPLTLLVIFLIEPNFFSITQFIARIDEFPALMENIVIYLITIIILELILKSIFAFVKIASLSGDETMEDTTTVKELVENRKDGQNTNSPVLVKKEEVFNYTPSANVNKKNKYFTPPKKVEKVKNKLKK